MTWFPWAPATGRPEREPNVICWSNDPTYDEWVAKSGDPVERYEHDHERLVERLRSGRE